ncbi:hypothetical protein KY284_010519 [Solanum tuberosum]|nr:hypothetical protein KY284_010519 [Solanum tuberosum]
MEAIFPPSFFTIMFHLVIYIGEEVLLADLVQGKPLGAIKTLSIFPLEIVQAHRYVLTNSEIIHAFREKLTIEVSRMHHGKRNSSKFVEEYVHKHFHEWFKEHNCVEITPEIELLSNGPNNVVRRFKEYNIHGFKFRTVWKEQGLITQNSGIVMSAVTQRFSNGREYVKQSSDDMYYDTRLNEGIKIDQFGMTIVTFSRLIC